MSSLTVTRTYSLVRSILRGLTTVLFDLKVYGAHHVPASGGVLLAANHASYLDPPMVGVQVRRAVSFFAKSELFENPWMGATIRNLHAFPVRQGAGDIGAVREAIKRLREGNVLNIFPEGGRTPHGQLQPIAPGIALIVRKANVPVVPVYLEGAYYAWPRHRRLFRTHPCRVLFWPPMQLSHLPAKEIVGTIDRVWREMRQDLARIEAQRKWEGR